VIAAGQSGLTLQSADELIFLGSITLSGQNANLTVQSDQWIHWEGATEVTNNLSLYGGVELDGTDRAGADASGTSVYIDPTARLITTQAGSDIVIRGSPDQTPPSPSVPADRRSSTPPFRRQNQSPFRAELRMPTTTVSLSC
jgi:hypothetical protein